MRGLEEEEVTGRRNRGHPELGGGGMPRRPVSLDPREGGGKRGGRGPSPSRAWEALGRNLGYFPHGTCRCWSPEAGESLNAWAKKPAPAAIGPRPRGVQEGALGQNILVLQGRGRVGQEGQVSGSAQKVEPALLLWSGMQEGERTGQRCGRGQGNRWPCIWGQGSGWG